MREEIGHRLRAARELRRMTLQQLAEKMGLSASRLSNYENGIREPDAATVRRIGAALGQSPAQLMFGITEIGSDSAELTAPAARLVNGIVNADQQGCLDADAIDALWSVLAVFLRLKLDTNKRRA